MITLNLMQMSLTTLGGTSRKLSKVSWHVPGRTILGANGIATDFCMFMDTVCTYIPSMFMYRSLWLSRTFQVSENVIQMARPLLQTMRFLKSISAGSLAFTPAAILLIEVASSTLALCPEALPVCCELSNTCVKQALSLPCL